MKADAGNPGRQSREVQELLRMQRKRSASGSDSSYSSEPAKRERKAIDEGDKSQSSSSDSSSSESDADVVYEEPPTRATRGRGAAARRGRGGVRARARGSARGRGRGGRGAALVAPSVEPELTPNSDGDAGSPLLVGDRKRKRFSSPTAETEGENGASRAEAGETETGETGKDSDPEAAGDRGASPSPEADTDAVAEDHEDAHVEEALIAVPELGSKPSMMGAYIEVYGADEDGASLRPPKLHRTTSTTSKAESQTSRASSPVAFKAASRSRAANGQASTRESSTGTSAGATARQMEREDKRVARDVNRQKGLATLQRERRLIEDATHPLYVALCSQLDSEYAEQQRALDASGVVEVQAVDRAAATLDCRIWESYIEERRKLRLGMLRTTELGKQHALLEHWDTDPYGSSFLNVDKAPDARPFRPIGSSKIRKQKEPALRARSTAFDGTISQPPSRNWRLDTDGAQLDLEAIGLREPSASTLVHFAGGEVAVNATGSGHAAAPKPEVAAPQPSQPAGMEAGMLYPQPVAAGPAPGYPGVYGAYYPADPQYFGYPAAAAYPVYPLPLYSATPEASPALVAPSNSGKRAPSAEARPKEPANRTAPAKTEVPSKRARKAAEAAAATASSGHFKSPVPEPAPIPPSAASAANGMQTASSSRPAHTASPVPPTGILIASKVEAASTGPPAPVVASTAPPAMPQQPLDRAAVPPEKVDGSLSVLATSIPAYTASAALAGPVL